MKMATKDLGLDTRIPEKDNADWPAGAVVDARDQVRGQRPVASGGVRFRPNARGWLQVLGQGSRGSLNVTF